VCFGSPEDFDKATDGKDKHDYCKPMATGQHCRFKNIPYVPMYWEHAAGWSSYISQTGITLQSLFAWLTGREGKHTRFYGMGNLVGWLLASDYAYAGLVDIPEVSVVGEIIFKINAGGMAGLELLGLKVDTKEACAEAMRLAWTAVNKSLTPTEIVNMGLDPITLEHALCKFKRLKGTIAKVS
jgi:hypothetical protein